MILARWTQSLESFGDLIHDLNQIPEHHTKVAVVANEVKLRNRCYSELQTNCITPKTEVLYAWPMDWTVTKIWQA